MTEIIAYSVNLKSLISAEFQMVFTYDFHSVQRANASGNKDGFVILISVRGKTFEAFQEVRG